MKRIYDFSSFSVINEDVPAGATGGTEKTAKSYKGEKWYSYLEAIVNGIMSESYVPIVQLGPGKYDSKPDFESIKPAKTIEEKITAFEKILSNAVGSLDPKDIGYEELKKISQEYLNVGKKYITALPVLKEKSGTKGNEISDATNEVMDLLLKKLQENKPKDSKQG
jgi:hypothetical protein